MKQYITLIIILLSVYGFGQVENDTIRFKKIPVKTIKNLESLNMEIIDTLIKPKAFILKDENNTQVIAIKKRGKYRVFNLLQDDLYYGVVSKTKQVQINNKSYKELVVYWEDVNGHSGLGGGLRQEVKGIVIYDLKTLSLIFYTQNHYYNYTWNNDISEDLEVLSTEEEIECDNWEITLENKKITLELKETEKCSPINFLEYETTKQVYKLEKDKFVGYSFYFQKN